jgi:hypothetical protein
MPNYLIGIWENLLERTTGALILRFLLGPLISILAAVKFAKRDIKKQYPPYLYRFLATSRQRKVLKRQHRSDTFRLFLFSTSIDISYQIIAVDIVGVKMLFKPLESVLVAMVLTVIPYLFIRRIVYRQTAKRYEKDHRGANANSQRQPPHIH